MRRYVCNLSIKKTERFHVNRGVGGRGELGREVVVAKRIRVFLLYSQNNFLQLYLFYLSGTLIAY